MITLKKVFLGRLGLFPKAKPPHPTPPQTNKNNLAIMYFRVGFSGFRWYFLKNIIKASNEKEKEMSEGKPRHDSNRIAHKLTQDFTRCWV